MKANKIGCTFVLMLLLMRAFGQTYKFEHLFTLKGKLTTVHMDSVFLYYKNMDGSPVFQSQPIFSDRFIFSDSIKAPMKALILFKNIGEVVPEKDFEKRAKEIYLEHGLLTIEGDPTKLSQLKLTGSDSQDEADELNNKTAPIRAEMQPLVDAYNKETDPEKAAIMRTRFEPYEDRIKSISYHFFLDHPNSYITADQMLEYVNEVSLDSSRTIYKNFNAELRMSDAGKRLAAQIKKMEAALPGNMAVDFKTTDINGKSVSLADYKGKYVMLDFWASWCAPCRKGNPHMVELYKKYKEKGLNLIGIADDDATQAAWKNAIAKDSVGIWPNVLWGANTDNDIGDKYAIHFVPTRILIDPTGKIIGRFGDNDDRDDKMDKMLAAIFPKKD